MADTKHGVVSFVPLAEITTPATTPSIAKLYAKSDNLPYFQDGAGIEHAVQIAGSSVSQYGEMYLNVNATATTLETVDEKNAVRYMTTGALNGFTFAAGKTAAITAYSDGTGKTNVASGTHGLVTGDYITIRGTTSYNGIQTVTKIDNDNFSITAAWAADDGASDWEEASYLQYTAGTSVVFAFDWNMSSTKAGGTSATVLFTPVVNATTDAPGRVQREFTGSDVGAFGGQAILTLSAGDRVYLVMESDNTDDITNNYGCLRLTQL